MYVEMITRWPFCEEEGDSIKDCRGLWRSYWREIAEILRGRLLKGKDNDCDRV
jgi:hypothetical protein